MVRGVELLCVSASISAPLSIKEIDNLYMALLTGIMECGASVMTPHIKLNVKFK